MTTVAVSNCNILNTLEIRDLMDTQTQESVAASTDAAMRQLTPSEQTAQTEAKAAAMQDLSWGERFAAASAALKGNSAAIQQNRTAIETAERRVTDAKSELAQAQSEMHDATATVVTEFRAGVDAVDQLISLLQEHKTALEASISAIQASSGTDE